MSKNRCQKSYIILYTFDGPEEKTVCYHFNIIHIGINYRNITLHKTKVVLLNLKRYRT